MEFDNLNLFTELVSKCGLNLFLGAGFSVYAKNFIDESLPLGNDICEQIVKVFDLDIKKQWNLSQACEIIKTTNQDALSMFLRDKYKVKEFDPVYYNMCKLPIKNIITVNIDNLIEKIYDSNQSTASLSDVKINGFIEKDNIINLYKLHGSVTYPAETRLSFTEQELHDLFIIDNNLFHAVSLKLVSCPTIYWGTSLYDSNSIQLLSKANKVGGLKPPKWLVLYPCAENERLETYFRGMDFNIIKADIKELIQYLMGLPFVKREIGNRYMDKKYYEMFSDNFVCNALLQTIPVRPISDFFYGAEPQISDVVSENIVYTSYFAKAHNLILKNRITLITGIPGCGKSTLLMQLAFSKQVQKRKFWFNNMIESEAKRLAELVKNDSDVYIFLDNLSNNLQAFEILKEYKNLKIIMAERSINYEFIKRNLKLSRDSILDISNLELTDIQNICQMMQRDSSEAIELLKKNKNISLLEIVFFIFRSMLVKNRIKEYIAMLEKREGTNSGINLLELYTLVNYISYCQIPTSFDMLLFYFGSDHVRYTQIQEAIGIMTSIIVEEEPEDCGLSEIQDYVSMRSRMFAELSIHLIPMRMLAHVLQKFLKNVSSFSIYRYDIFKKKAYDADLTNRAFTLQSGTQFYQEVLLNNASPYVRHQYALFLLRKGDIEQAWQQIDKAYTECNRKIFTIANTHAMILFEKNISSNPRSQEEVIKVKDVLLRTFSTLSYCIKKDMKVNYHVLIYSRNAVRYIDKFGKDENGIKYLAFAREELEKVLCSKDYIYGRLYSELKAIFAEVNSLSET